MKGLFKLIILLFATCNFTIAQQIYSNPPIFIDSLHKKDVTCNGTDDGAITIYASGLDSLEYSLDGINFRLDNEYTNLGPGEYTPFVRGSSKIPSLINVLYEYDITINWDGENKFSLPGTLIITEKIPSESKVDSTNDFDIAIITNQSPSVDAHGAIHFATNTSLINIIKPHINAINQDIPFGPSELNPDIIKITLLDNIPNPYNVYSLSDTLNPSSVFEIISGDLYFQYDNEMISGTINFEGRSSTSKTESIYTGSITGRSKKTFTDIFESFFVAKGENISIIEPDSLILNIANVKHSCGDQNNGEITVSASGGSGSYQYSISSYPFTEPQFFSDNGSFDSLYAAYYRITVRDSNLCTTETYINIDSTSDILPIPTIELNTDEGPSNEVYLLSINESNNIWFRNGEEIEGENEQNLKITDGGSYQVKVISESGCESVSEEFNIDWYPINIQDPIVENPSCSGLENGKLGISATVGEGTLEYSLDGQNYVPGSTFENLAAGDYTYYVRGSQNNDYVESRDFTISEPEMLELIILEETGPNCPGENSGSIQASASGGTGPYSFGISTQEQSNGEGIFEGLPEGEFTVIVRDQYGCEAVKEVNLSTTDDFPPVPTIELNTDGGPSNEVYLLSSSVSNNIWFRNGEEIEGENEQNLKITDGGSYQVKVISASGCESVSELFNIDWYPINIQDPIVENPSCTGLENGKLGISATVGEGTLEYSLDGQNYVPGSTFENLAAGDYTYYVRGSQNINYIESRDFTISEPEMLELIILEETGPNCPGGNSGTIRVSASGGTGPYTFGISTQEQTNGEGIFEGLPEGVFTVTLRDQNGCEAVKEVPLKTIGEYPPIPEITIKEPDGTPSGVGLVSSSPFNNQWILDNIEIPGATGQFFEIEQPGVYQVRVTSEEGCSSISESLVLTNLEEERPLSISLNPNPAEHSVKISFNKPTELQMLKIFNINGVLVKDFENNILVRENLEIDLNGLAAGIYYIQLGNEEFNQILKLYKK